MAHRSLALIACLFLASVAPALAQAPDQTYAAAARAAADALAVAERSGETPHPDRPVWSAAFEAGEGALRTARGTGGQDDIIAALRFNGRVYALVGWYSRAFEAFQELLALGARLGEEPVPSAVPDLVQPSDRDLFVAAATQLGFARYQAGDTEGARGYYLRVLEVVPDEQEALRWLGRIAFEQSDVEGARTAVEYFERLAGLYPDDESAAYYAGLSRDRVAFGVTASDAFQAGLQRYEAGMLEDALVEFTAALAANPAYVDAAVWAGRIELELGRPARSVPHWRSVVEARPDDAGAAWFLGYAQTQERWGVEAGERYYRGLAAYENGDLETAIAEFSAATQANDAFVDAFVWAARSLQENGQPLEAIPFWERVLALDPGDDRAQWYLTRARQALEFGPVAGPAYYDALAHYQAGDPDEAERLLRIAVAADPDFAQAWGYLGRIAFQDGRFAEAEEAYGRAAAAAPDVDDYAFFAEEARRMQAPDEVEDVVPLAPGGEAPDEAPEREPGETPQDEDVDGG